MAVVSGQWTEWRYLVSHLRKHPQTPTIKFNVSSYPSHPLPSTNIYMYKQTVKNDGPFIIISPKLTLTNIKTSQIILFWQKLPTRVSTPTPELESWDNCRQNLKWRRSILKRPSLPVFRWRQLHDLHFFTKIYSTLKRKPGRLISVLINAWTFRFQFPNHPAATQLWPVKIYKTVKTDSFFTTALEATGRLAGFSHPI